MLPRPQTATLPPPETRALLLQAGALAQAQDYDRAEATYIAVLEQAPDWDIARFQLGLLQFTGGRPTVAATTWRALDRLDDGHPLKLFKAGFEYLARDAFAAAIDAFERGIALNTENMPLNRDIAMVIDRIRQTVPTAVPPSERTDGDTTATPADHFLVSNYRNLN
jgi:tetratricopeptide (TPR) repeat protein